MQTIQEMTEALIYAGAKKGLKFPTRTTETEEKFLSDIKSICEASGVKLKIDRKNGGRQNFSEADSKSRDEQILTVMQDSRFNYRDACYVIGEKPERDVRQPASITEAIGARWKKHSPWISEKDARTLAEMGKLP